MKNKNSIMNGAHTMSWSLASEPPSPNIMPRLPLSFHIRFHGMFLLPSLIILIYFYRYFQVVAGLFQI
jgi:hypothetical protein